MNSRPLLLSGWLAACWSCGREEPLRLPLYLVPVGTAGEAPADLGRVTVVRVEIAADPANRHRGLMERRSLPVDTGMLFIYPDERPREFWMKNTRIPLSIAYLDRTGTILTILHMEPDPETPGKPLPVYPSGRPAIHALEMEQGWFAAHGVHVGDRVRYHPSLLAVRAE